MPLIIVILRMKSTALGSYAAMHEWDVNVLHRLRMREIAMLAIMGAYLALIHWRDVLATFEMLPTHRLVRVLLALHIILAAVLLLQPIPSLARHVSVVFLGFHIRRHFARSVLRAIFLVRKGVLVAL